MKHMIERGIALAAAVALCLAAGAASANFRRPQEGSRTI